MRSLATVAILLFLSASAYAQAPKPCEDLKAEIAKKIEANQVKSYTLEVVEKDKEAEGKVVGTCDGGTKKIVYRRDSAPAAAQTKETDVNKGTEAKKTTETNKGTETSKGTEPKK